MMQHQVTHPAGTFALCIDCEREPKHFVSLGKKGLAPIGGNNEQHQLECCPCNLKTSKCDSLQIAKSEWRMNYGKRASVPTAVLKLKHAN